jgi:hypothetical protein
MNGKIARLPRHIRDELNRRLDDAQDRKSILAWLNALPETQAIIGSDFHGIPVSRQNLHEWTRTGFARWRMHRDAFAFIWQEEPRPDAPLSPGGLNDKLVHWSELRLAAAAHCSPPAGKDLEANSRQLHAFVADVLALRRGALHSQRVALDFGPISSLALKH